MSVARPHRNAWLKAALPYLLIALLLLPGFLWMGTLPDVRVGDGSEYYAMFYAWSAGHRPWLTPEAQAAYQHLFDSGHVTGLVSYDWFHATFPALQLGSTADLNHFWFYSALAALCQASAAVFHVTLGIQGSFLMLHWLLLSATGMLAYRLYGWRGVGVIAAMTLASPVLWFVNKAHTELFTVCLLLSAMMLLNLRRYVPAALLLALASTQNPSFALIAVIPLGYRVLLGYRERYTLAEVAMLVGTVLAVLLHPAYYFMRYGVVTPQLLAGGAKMGQELSSFYIWLIDPDLGLLTNWPLGLAALLLAAGLWLFRRPLVRPDWTVALFATLYLLINFYAHSSTTTINSGGTPGLARYALWYLPLGFALMYRLALNYPWRSLAGYLLLPVVLGLSAATAWRYDPRGHESYVTPSDLSFLVQSHLAWLYNPPAQVFMERYSGLGEETAVNVTVGPDCRKLLLVPVIPKRGIATPSKCLFDPIKLDTFERQLAPGLPPSSYLRLSKAQAMTFLLTVHAGLYQVSDGSAGSFVLAEGWNHPEDWGVWSKGKLATLMIPCNSQQFFKPDEAFHMALKLQPFGQQTLTVRAQDTVLWHGALVQGGPDVHFNVPAQNCKDGASRIALDISNPTSPQQLGMSPDTRMLGVALRGFELGRAN